MADPSLPPSPKQAEKLSDENRILSEAFQKIADRPHHMTMFLSMAAIVVSLIAAYLSWRSYDIAASQYRLALVVREEVKETARMQREVAEKARVQNAKNADDDRQQSGER